MNVLKVFVPTSDNLHQDRRRLFWPSRLFFRDGAWGYFPELFHKWSISETQVAWTTDLKEASIMLLPYTVNDYVNFKKLDQLVKYNQWCRDHGIVGYAGIVGDLGVRFPEFDRLVYFRMGGFRSQLSNRNIAMPFALSDQLPVFAPKGLPVRDLSSKPVVGFCGHATTGPLRFMQESAKFLWENARRCLSNPFRADWEPVFPSAFHRARLLGWLQQAPGLSTNFILRERYRAGASSPEALEATTREYYQNMLDSDYVLCLRGGGNFSVRLFETLMMGRIPVFVNTDCLLPFSDWLDWRQHVVWVEWHERRQLAEKIRAFHDALSGQQFADLQLRNREFWMQKMGMRGMFDYLRWRQKSNH